MLNARKLALRDRKRRKPDWKDNPANPDMVVYTRLLMWNGQGQYDKIEIELKPREMSEIAAESLEHAEADSGKPRWDHDPLYHAAKRLRKARRARAL